MQEFSLFYKSTSAYHPSFTLLRYSPPGNQTLQSVQAGRCLQIKSKRVEAFDTSNVAEQEKMSVLFWISFSILLSVISSINGELKDDYDHFAYLDVEEKYKLFWSVKHADQSIHFAAQVNTTGWVGFGISKGLTGNMVGADLVIGGVDGSKKGYLKDYHSESNGPPTQDKSQDYEYVGASEANGVTILKFKRKINTCDKQDRDIIDGTSKVIYAYGHTDAFGYHAKRGAKSLNLKSYVKNIPPPKTAKYFDFLSVNVTVPKRKTTYWCQAIKVSDVIKLHEKKHIIEIEPIVDKKDAGIVHHMVVYVCKDDFNETHLNMTGPCFDHNMPPSIKECVPISPMFAWAVGGTNFKYPAHAGWPIGTPDSIKFVVLETHFDNPTLNDEFVVTNGLRFYYDKPRKYDAGTLSTGLISDHDSFIIPPRQEKWFINGYCSKACSSKLRNSASFNGSEVRLFASFPHAHTVANGIWTKLVRDGKEVVEVIKDDNYDFDFQQTYLLQREIPFKAGDELITTCRYNTMQRPYATVGGESTTDEMCLNFIMYYPSVNISFCATVRTKVDHFSKKYKNQITNDAREAYKNWVGVQWNNSMIEELKKLERYQGRDATISLCSNNAAKVDTKRANRPVISVPLPTPRDVCTNLHSASTKLSISSWIFLFLVLPFINFGFTDELLFA